MTYVGPRITRGIWIYIWIYAYEWKEKWTQSAEFSTKNGPFDIYSCTQQVSVLKEYNIWLDHETDQAKKYNSLQGQLRREKINEVLDRWCSSEGQLAHC